MEMFDRVIERRFISDDETLRDMVKELDWKEAQITFADVTARMCAAKTADPQLYRESEAANKRLFALFEQGWTAGDKLLFKAYWAYKARLCTRHKWES